MQFSATARLPGDTDEHPATMISRAIVRRSWFSRSMVRRDVRYKSKMLNSLCNAKARKLPESRPFGSLGNKVRPGQSTSVAL